MDKESILKSGLGERSSFQMDLDKYRYDYQSLLNSRGVDPIQSWLNQPITEESIAGCLNYFYENLPIGILLYFYEEGKLITWLLDGEGIKYEGESDVDKEMIISLEEKLKQGLNLSALGESRRPLKRSLTWQKKKSKIIVDLPGTILEISKLLFPAGLISTLNELGTKHLIIVPALNLQQIPFALLNPFQDGTQFVDRFSYSIASSVYDIADLLLQKGQGSENKRMFLDSRFEPDKSLFVGNPIYSTEGEWILPPLPGAEEEVKYISESLAVPPEQVLIGKDATKESVTGKCAKADLIYFATHGVATPENPLDESGLFFTPSKADPSGFLSAREIQEMKMSASLVILSACQTGLGQSEDAGVIGLSRAFHLAGAENILMSLWSVDDNATKELMKIFMEKIQEPHLFSPGEPLRLAMQEYRKVNPNPLFWASFSTLGIPI